MALPDSRCSPSVSPRRYRYGRLIRKSRTASQQAVEYRRYAAIKSTKWKALPDADEAKLKRVLADPETDVSELVGAINRVDATDFNRVMSPDASDLGIRRGRMTDRRESLIVGLARGNIRSGEVNIVGEAVRNLYSLLADDGAVSARPNRGPSADRLRYGSYVRLRDAKHGRSVGLIRADGDDGLAPGLPEFDNRCVSLRRDDTPSWREPLVEIFCLAIHMVGRPVLRNEFEHGGGDVVGGCPLLIEKEHPFVARLVKRGEVLHVRGDDDQFLLANVGENIRFVIGIFVEHIVGIVGAIAVLLEETGDVPFEVRIDEKGPPHLLVRRIHIRWSIDIRFDLCHECLALATQVLELGRMLVVIEECSVHR